MAVDANDDERNLGYSSLAAVECAQARADMHWSGLRATLCIELCSLWFKLHNAHITCAILVSEWFNLVNTANIWSMLDFIAFRCQRHQNSSLGMPRVGKRNEDGDHEVELGGNGNKQKL